MVPVQGVAYEFYIALVDSNAPETFIEDPTIEAGDFQVSTDGGAFANLTTLPVVSPAGSRNVLVSLSATEMNGEKVTVQAVDQAGSEWEQAIFTIDVPEGSVESVYDIQTGDHVETSTNITIRKRGTATAVLEKDITGSLLDPDVTITTTDS